MGRGKHQSSLALIEASKRILAEIQPATVRAVCYQLFVAKIIPNMSKNSTARVSKQLTWAREAGHIDWNWIVDETREAETISMWSDPSSFITPVKGAYRKDLWREQERDVEVWSEKGTVRGTLAPVLREYGVTFRVLHGFSSSTAIHEAAEASQWRPFTVLYVGDRDPSGMHMPEVDIPIGSERSSTGRHGSARARPNRPRSPASALCSPTGRTLFRDQLANRDGRLRRRHRHQRRHPPRRRC